MRPANRSERHRRPLALGLLLMTPLSASRVIAFGQESMPDFQYDPVEHWAARTLTWLLILSAVFVGYLLVRTQRGQSNGVAVKGLLFVGVVMLPSFSVTTGMLLVFTRAEHVEFCGSCHGAMSAYVEDMMDPMGEGLAAIHYRDRDIPSNQCYTCHTSYGLFGTFEAKLQGMGEVVRYYTGTYEAPITMWRPYSNADCLKCHAGSTKWLAVAAHSSEGTAQELFNDTVSCMECHVAGHDVGAEAKDAA
jgi:nitrate/TMAO reductase-like tetraheme cytochrome c subunit